MSNTSSTPEGPNAGEVAGGPDGDPVLDGPDGRRVDGAERTRDAARVGRLVEVLALADRCYAEAVGLMTSLEGTGVVEREEGVTMEVLLAAIAGLTGPDRGALTSVVAVLRDLPAVAQAFAEGRVSWGQVRAIVRAARRRSKADRAVIDARVAATLDAARGSDDPDQLVWAVEACAEQLRAARERAKSEQRRLSRSFFSVQPAFDGGARVYGELAPLDAASLLAALDAAAPPPTSPRTAAARAGDTPTRDPGAGPGEGHGGDLAGDPPCVDGGGVGWSATARSRDYASALTRITTEWLTTGHAGHDDAASDRGCDCHDNAAGDQDGGAGVGGAHNGCGVRESAPDSGEPAGDGRAGDDGAGDGRASENRADEHDPHRPPAGRAGTSPRRAPRSAITCHVDLTAAAPQPDGTLALRLRGDLPRLTATALEALATDATVRVVLSSGQQPLAVTRAKRIPAAVRTVTAGRDHGCRAPGCTAPADWADLHHYRVPQAVTADHDPDGLSAFCRRHHRMIERHGWQLTLHPHSGQITFTRDDRTWTTLPNGTALANAPPAIPADDSPF